MDMTIGDTQLIVAVCKERGLLRNQTAYLLATTWWETAHTMLPVEEAFYLKDRVSDLDAWRKRNLRYYPWHARGYVGVTWERNYHKLSKETGVDVVSQRSKAMEKDVAAVALVVGCMQGWWTGKKLTDYVTLQKSDFVGARRVVNGTDKARAIAEVARDYDDALLTEGYGVTQVSPPVANERRDGTPPRDSIFSSKTIRAALAAIAAMIANTSEQLQSVVSTVTETFGVSAEMALLVVGLAAAGYVLYDRNRKFKHEDDR